MPENEIKKMLLKKGGVIAVGMGIKVSKGKKTGQEALICSVIEKKPEDEISKDDLIPRQLPDGTLTDVVETGKIEFLKIKKAQSVYTERHRPAPAGVSVGHYSITAGTLGCFVEDESGTVYILSNNHVLADVNRGSVGDPILQPGSYDGGRVPDDTIAELSRFIEVVGSDSAPNCSVASMVLWVLNLAARVIGSSVRLKQVFANDPVNLVDCAIAEILTENVKNEVIGLGKITGTSPANLGDSVIKAGRTTGITQGEILQVDVMANVDMGNGLVAVFDDQLLMGPISDGGDSGSAILKSDMKLTGLLFAGSDKVTIANRIENVFSALGVYLYTG